MAYTATITMADGEQFTATSVTITAGKVEFTGASGLTSRSNLGLRVDSATAGAAIIGHIASMSVA